MKRISSQASVALAVVIGCLIIAGAVYLGLRGRQGGERDSASLQPPSQINSHDTAGNANGPSINRAPVAIPTAVAAPAKNTSTSESVKNCLDSWSTTAETQGTYTFIFTVFSKETGGTNQVKLTDNSGFTDTANASDGYFPYIEVGSTLVFNDGNGRRFTVAKCHGKTAELRVETPSTGNIWVSPLREDLQAGPPPG